MAIRTDTLFLPVDRPPLFRTASFVQRAFRYKQYQWQCSFIYCRMLAMKFIEKRVQKVDIFTAFSKLNGGGTGQKCKGFFT